MAMGLDDKGRNYIHFKGSTKICINIQKELLSRAHKHVVLDTGETEVTCKPHNPRHTILDNEQIPNCLGLVTRPRPVCLGWFVKDLFPLHTPDNSTRLPHWVTQTVSSTIHKYYCTGRLQIYVPGVSDIYPGSFNL